MMSRLLTCDHCQETINGEPFELIYPIQVDDDEDAFTEAAEFCSLACLANWAMAHTLDNLS